MTPDRLGGFTRWAPTVVMGGVHFRWALTTRPGGAFRSCPASDHLLPCHRGGDLSFASVELLSSPSESIWLLLSCSGLSAAFLGEGGLNRTCRPGSCRGAGLRVAAKPVSPSFPVPVFFFLLPFAFLLPQSLLPSFSFFFFPLPALFPSSIFFTQRIAEKGQVNTMTG